MEHDAFISYSRKNRLFTNQIKRTLESFKPPKDLDIPQRHLNIFRDEEDFTGVEYYTAVDQHLRASRKLIVICSPDARTSPYVDEEIRRFAETNGADNIIPILLDGVPNNEATPEQGAAMAFPDALLAVMRMPLAIDYRGFVVGKHKVDRRIYEGSWYWLLANLYGVERSEIEQRDKRRKARVRKYWRAGAAAGAAVIVILSAWALTERIDALRRQSAFLAERSREQTDAGHWDLGIKLALEALPRRIAVPDRPWVRTAENALYSAVAQQQFRAVVGGPRSGFGDSLNAARISPDGTRAALDYGGVQTELWNLVSGELVTALRPADSSYVTQTAFSPDGKLLAVGYKTFGNVIESSEPLERRWDVPFNPDDVRGSVVEIVDAHTGTPVRKFQMPGHQENHIQFSPSGDLLLFATDEQFALIDTSRWEDTGGDSWKSVGVDLAPPYAQISFSDDEKRIAIATEKGYAAVIDRAAIAVLDLYRSESRTTGMRFIAHNGDKLVACLGERVWIMVPGNPQLPTVLSSGEHQPVLTCGFSSEHSAAVAITADGRVHSWMPDGKRIDSDAKSKNRGVLRQAFLDVSATNAIVEWEDGAVEYWDLRSDERTQVFQQESGRHLVSVGFEHGDRLALLAGDDSFVRVWDRAAAGGPKRLDTQGKKASAAVFRPHTRQVAIGYSDGGIQILDPTRKEPIWSPAIVHKGAVLHLAFDPSGERLVSTSEDLTARIWTIRGNAQSISLEGHTKAPAFGAFSPDGNLVVTGSSDSTFRVWNSRTGEIQNILAIPDSFLDSIHNASINPQAAFTSDGSRLVTVTSGDGYVIGQPALVWDMTSWKLEHPLSHPQAAIWNIAISPDDRFVATASYDNSSALWDIRTGERKRTFPGHPVKVLKATFCDQGRLLATASPDGTLRIWQTDSERIVHDVKIKPALVDLEADHEGHSIAVGSSQEGAAEVGIWDVIEGRQLISIKVAAGPLVPLSGIAFSDDDRSLLTITESGIVTIWPLPPKGQKLIDLARQRIASDGEELLTPEQRARFGVDTR